MGRCQKLGIILEYKVMLSKNVKKSNCGTFKPKSQDSIISFEHVDSYAKNLSNFVPPFENSTTHIAINKVLCWKMVSKIAGMVAISRKVNVPGVAQMVGAVEKIGLEMDAMVILVGQTIINAYLKQVLINIIHSE